ncbi:MAG: peptide-N4-asparagine amidase [Candidatus Acidiferrales bacterium]
MNTVPGSFQIRLSLMALALMPLLALPGAARAQGTPPVIGSQNTVTADPPVSRPNEKPCVVQLFSGFQFVNYNIQDYQFTPSCPGPFEKIVFTADFNVTAGVQYDRTAIVDLAYVNIYFGTTPEPGTTLSPTWHVERDLTDYAALFGSAQTGHVILGNTVNSTYTGVISGSAELEFYPAQWPAQAPPAADAVLPLTQSNGSGGINEPATLNTGADQLATTFTLPQNIERAYLDVISQSQINDEFWYTCVPNDVATELESCGNTGFREAEISIDGQPAGVAPVYPWIYTGGVDPFLWAPIPGVQTLNFVPYRIDLTPFAGLLSNGAQHTVAVSVFNADSYFSEAASLLLYLDHGSQQVTGALTSNTIGAGPNPAVTENLQTDASGDITGSVSVTSLRQFGVAGFVNTSHGRIDTQVQQSVNFRNVQNFTINATTYDQDITQGTQVQSLTTTRQGPVFSETLESFRYPLTMNIDVLVAADGSESQTTTVSQEFDNNIVSPFFVSAVINKVNSTDTLNFDAAGNFTGNTGAKSSQTYDSFNTLGQIYSCSLASENNALTFASRGCTDQPSR